jgi:hypothetical protein
VAQVASSIALSCLFRIALPPFFLIMVLAHAMDNATRSRFVARDYQTFLKAVIVKGSQGVNLLGLGLALVRLVRVLKHPCEPSYCSM